MGIFSWFQKSAAPDYETLLSRLATDIDDAKTHLSEIRLRERRALLLVNAYGIALWAVWVGLWWVGGLPFGLLGWDARGRNAKVVGGAGIAAGPIFVHLLNRLLHLYFYRQRHSEESHLRKLLADQRKQVEEIKKITNYDSTRKLIERYDAGGGMPMPSTPPQGGGPETPSPTGRRGKKGQVTPQGSPRAPGHLAGAGGTPAQGPATPTPGPIPVPAGMTPDQAAALHFQMQAIQPVLPTPEKRWYDRIVDAVLGDDPSQATVSKYALVCGECFRHNGLVGSKYEWERMQWICPRCNHMNPPPLSRLKAEPPQAAPPQTPSSSSNPSPVPASPLSRASPRPRRQLGERGTPRSSRLGQEVFSASSAADDEESDEEVGDKMDIDEAKS
ncbi:hypothetical protein BCR39DRAFT_524090 [Naematelia encephala]|uniref:Endoplasmic reticulum junction formation protein lunapark n=1 Tax=Naematelia encephala TaxID=71784 RepID=A0A1Y2BC22_9TREE|nr:hypothetical protein BCR39DRAFT_524090 [Naematelia encephala]